MRSTNNDRFVNPYTFVPFSSTELHRAEPHGHRGNGQLWSGVLQLTITAHSPVLVRMNKPEPGDKPELPSRPGAGSANRQEIIPGSGLHGAVRSLHETLTGSCLRVFDPTFVPAYRDTAKSTADLRLAVVRRVDGSGRPTELQLCAPGDGRKLRIHQDVLERHQGLDSGTEVQVTQNQEGKVIDAHPQPGGGWIVFISDPGARDPGKPYHAAVRKLTDARIAGPQDEVWEQYLRSVEGADDRRTANQQPGQSALTQVTFTYTPASGPERKIVVGRRYRASCAFDVGQPVWVKLDQQRITRLQLAQLWRHPGQYAAGERLPPARRGGFSACSGQDWLCPSCRLFGSADTNEDGQPRPGYADQRAYRGHVRFSDAVPTDPVEPLAIYLPPTGSPHPGAGQFYLASGTDLVGNAAHPAHPALREWGAVPDRPPARPRQLRGRKFYWHTPGDHQERGNARQHQITGHPDQVQLVLAFPAGTRFTATVTLVDVDEGQLGSLLATLQPGSILGRDDLMVHIGGGRPLGYGSCTVTIETGSTDPGESGRSSRLWRSASRYRHQQPGDRLDLDADRDELLQAFRAGKDRADHETWRALAIVLRRDAVPADLVWYPPGRTWSDRAKHPDEFDEGFEFWQQTSGLRHADKDGVRQGHPFAPLPAVTDADQSMPITSGEAQIRPLRGKEL